MSNHDPSEVAFARKISPVSEQWAAVLSKELTGLAHDSLIVFDPNVNGRPNTALFKFENGDRSGRPLYKMEWRVNPAPSARAPSAWIDYPYLPLALWYDHQRGFYSVQRAAGALSSVREYDF